MNEIRTIEPGKSVVVEGLITIPWVEVVNEDDEAQPFPVYKLGDIEMADPDSFLPFVSGDTKVLMYPPAVRGNAIVLRFAISRLDDQAVGVTA